MGLDNLDQNYYDRSFPGTNHPWSTSSSKQVAKYRKKPVIIEAIQYTGKNSAEIADFMKVMIRTKTSPEEGNPSGKITIETLEGDMTASKGDFIIKGVQGEFYPCKPDIFEKTYEEVWD